MALAWSRTTMLQDLRFAVRGLAKQPGFTLVAVVTLALGIGADTAIFTVADATLRRALPYPDPGALAFLTETRKEGDWTDIPLTYPDFEDWRDQARSFVAVAAHQEVGVKVRTSEGTELARAASVSADFFKVLGVAPVLGRGFEPADTVPKAPRVAIL